MNSITITGNLTRDAELRSMNDGTAVLSFAVGDNQQGRDKKAIFWRSSLFGKRAEALAPYLKKGQQVTIVGSVTEREYTDKDGQKRTSIDVRVNDLALQGGRPEAQQEAPRAAQRATQRQARQSSGFDDMDSDIPF